MASPLANVGRVAPREYRAAVEGLLELVFYIELSGQDKLATGGVHGSGTRKRADHPAGLRLSLYLVGIAEELEMHRVLDLVIP